MTDQRETPFRPDLSQPFQEPEVTDNRQQIPRIRCVSQGRAPVLCVSDLHGLLTPGARHLDVRICSWNLHTWWTCSHRSVPSARPAGVTSGKGFSPPPVAVVSREKEF